MKEAALPAGKDYEDEELGLGLGGKFHEAVSWD